MDGHELRRRVRHEEQPYEEALGSPLEQGIKQVDHAILKGLVRTGLQPGQLRVQELTTAPAPQGVEAQDYHYQRMVVRRETPPEPFIRALREELDQTGGEVRIERMDAETWRISVLGHPTHELLFLPPEMQEQAPLAVAEGGRLVIVMDDLGLDLGYARALALLPVPVTFSVLPRLPQTRGVAALAREYGCELLLHQPMEPVDLSKHPGAGALFVGVGTERLRRLLLENLAQVPGAVGLNNHMGSRFTQDSQGVREVVRVAAEQGLFVLDSRTHERSLLARAAEQAGVPTLRRDVFLDVVRETAAIEFQLRKAEQLARQQGQAVAIGHPHPETLQALRRWSVGREPGVLVTTAGALLQVGEDGALAAGQGPIRSENRPF